MTQNESSAVSILDLELCLSTLEWHHHHAETPEDECKEFEVYHFDCGLVVNKDKLEKVGYLDLLKLRIFHRLHHDNQCPDKSDYWTFKVEILEHATKINCAHSDKLDGYPEPIELIEVDDNES